MKVCTVCKEESPLTNFHKKRNSLNSSCKDCIRLKDKKYQARSNELRRKRYQECEETRVRSLGSTKVWHSNNKEYRREYVASWKNDNPDKVKQYWATHYANNRAHYIQKAEVRSGRLRIQSLTACDLTEITAVYDKARTLTEETGVPHEVDHIVPLQGVNISGLHVPWNLQVLTREENRKKSNN